MTRPRDGHRTLPVPVRGAHPAGGTVAPADGTIASLRTVAEQIRRAELARLERSWEDLSPADRRRLEELTERLVRELLREPIVRLRRSPADAGQLESVRHLFGLDDASQARAAAS